MRPALKIFSFLPKEAVVRLTDGRAISKPFALVGNYCLEWQKDKPKESISALVSAIRPIPEMIVIGTNEQTLLELGDIPCSIEQTDPVSYRKWCM